MFSNQLPQWIFLVEDNPGDATLVMEALREIGANIQIEVAGDGARGWERLLAREFAAELPDLIILNFNLPRVSGPELLRRIRSHASLAAVPVIMLTSTTTESDRSACVGVQDYLIKATSWEDTLGIARRIVGILNPEGPVGAAPTEAAHQHPEHVEH